MIPLIPIVLFVALQATFGVKYEKDHGHGLDKEIRIVNERNGKI